MDKDKKKFRKKQQKNQGEHKLLIPQKKKKAKSVALYLLGSAAVTVGMAAVMPKGMGKVGQKIYTESLKKQGDDDWTQEILNRRQAEAEAEEEKKNG